MNKLIVVVMLFFLTACGSVEKGNEIQQRILDATENVVKYLKALLDKLGGSPPEEVRKILEEVQTIQQETHKLDQK